jgi:hypothetical protein
VNLDELDLITLALPAGDGVCLARGAAGAPGHDIPHPIGDPDEDEGLPGEDDDDEDEDEEDDEEPMQV